MRSLFTICLALALLALTQTLAPAATLEVTHSPASGQYGTIKDAIAAAQSGDVIEIIDNSAPYTNPIVYQKGDDSFTLTIRGKAGLDPRPTVAPTAANAVVSPFDGGLHPIVTANGTLTLENLIIDDSDTAYNLPIDLRGDVKATINNVKLTTTADTDAVNIFDLLSEKDITLTNCDFTIGKPFYINAGTATVNTTKLTFTGFGIWVMGGATVTMDQMTISGGGSTISGGTTTLTNSTNDSGINFAADNARGQAVSFTADHCTFTGPGTNVLGFPNAATRAATGTINANFTNSIITTHNADADNNLVVVNQGIDTVNLTLTNCDFVGNPSVNNTSSGILYGNVPSADSTVVAQTTANNTIFYNLKAAAFALINGAEADPSGIHEDYNAYQKAAPFINGPAALGAHDLQLADTDLLYIDPVGGNFHLFSASPAATIHSGATPAYAGSQGVGTGTAPTYGWPLQAVKTSTPPTLDGVINPTEWAPAGTPVTIDLRLSTLSAKDPYFATYTHNGSNAARAIANDADCSGLIYLMWDAQNFYVAVDAKDNDLEPQPNENNDPSTNVNRGDCFQICLDYDQLKATGVDAGKAYIPSWSITTNNGTQTASQGNADFYQFWPLSNPTPLTGTQWNLKTNATGYVFEAKIPWTAFTSGGDSYTKPFPPAEGQTAGMLPMLEDNDMVNGNLSVGFLYPAGSGDKTGATIGNPSLWNTVTFTSNPTLPVNAAHSWEVFE